MDHLTDPPTKLMLVQWSGLALKDTSWENWVTLNDSYNLEDKVVLPEWGDVSHGSNQPGNKPKSSTKRPA